MIREIWVRIIALLALAVIPIMALELKLQQDGIALVYDLAERTGIRSSLDDFLSQLRESARENPSKEGYFKEKFGEASKTKRSLEEFFLARASIDKDIRSQTLLLMLVVLTLSLIGSFWISRGILKRVHVLIEERERAAAKLRGLNALQNWQNVARILVHELRAPITPIKLVTTDLDYKYKTMSHEAFGKYLHDAQKLVNEQILAIEDMVEGFTKFGKLPDPELNIAPVQTFLDDFVATYGRSFGELVTMTAVPGDRSWQARLDTKLLRDLIFNICKNAAEANQGKTHIELRLTADDHSILLSIANSGRTIPASIRKTLFDPYVSTKTDSNQSNMGLGLAIARKIALDHGGDLSLKASEEDDGVTFVLELPRIK